MLEREIEGYLVKRIKEAGGRAYKWSSPSHRGVPDRLCVLNGSVFAVELKAAGKKPTPLQLNEHRFLESRGLNVHIVDSKEKVEEVLRWYS